jgi:hypothetical protein
MTGQTGPFRLSNCQAYAGPVASDIPNAAYVRPGPSWREREYPPKHAPVWVRIDGTWQKGLIIRWVTIDPARMGWECRIETQVSASDRRTARYVYDERSIRPRHGSDPPAE